MQHQMLWTIINNHAYVSLKDCVAGILGHGLDLDIIYNDLPVSALSKLRECKLAKEIPHRSRTEDLCDKTPLCLYIIECSDTF